MPSTDSPPLLLVSDPGCFGKCTSYRGTPAVRLSSRSPAAKRVIRRATAEWVEAVKSAGSFGAWAWDVAVEPGQVNDIITKHAA
jgi:hypothetical protein